eukprot:COSAG01_NODE_28378_length_662_cov_1.367673_1_plen_138_part_00
MFVVVLQDTLSSRFVLWICMKYQCDLVTRFFLCTWFTISSWPSRIVRRRRRAVPAVALAVQLQHHHRAAWAAAGTAVRPPSTVLKYTHYVAVRIDQHVSDVGAARKEWKSASSSHLTLRRNGALSGPAGTSAPCATV